MLALLAIAALRLARALRAPADLWREILAVGLAAGLIGHLVWNMADTVVQGYNPSVYLWVALGLAAGLPTSRSANRSALGRPDREDVALPVRS